MKILQIVPAYFPAISIGGPIFSSLALARILSQRHSVDGITTPLGLSAEERSKVIYDRRLKSRTGGHIVYKRYYGYPHFTFSPGTAVWLDQRITDYDLAIFHGVWNFPFLAAAHACQKHSVPYVVFPHGTLLPERVEMRSSLMKRLMLDLYVRRMLEKAACVACTSEYEVRKTEKLVGSSMRPFLIPNIVEAAAFADLPERGVFRRKHGIAETTQVLVHYGRITHVKGIEFVLLSLAALRRQGRDVMFVIVGGDDGGYRAVVQAFIDKHGLNDAVLFTGLLGREDSKMALTDADVFVLPSYSENFAMAAVEAMLCGLPVVVSDNVGIADELARADVGVVISLDPEANSLTQALARLLDDEEHRKSLSTRGRQFAIDHYDSPAVETRAEEMIIEATRNAAPRAKSRG